MFPGLPGSIFLRTCRIRHSPFDNLAELGRFGAMGASNCHEHEEIPYALPDDHDPRGLSQTRAA